MSRSTAAAAALRVCNYSRRPATYSAAVHGINQQLDEAAAQTMCVLLGCTFMSANVGLLYCNNTESLHIYVDSRQGYWLGLLTCKNRLPYNLYCVGGDVKHCSINQSINQGYCISLIRFLRLCQWQQRKATSWLDWTLVVVPVCWVVSTCLY